MTALRHFEPPPSTGQPPTRLSRGTKAVADEAQNCANIGARKVPHPARPVVDAIDRGVQNEDQNGALHVEHVAHVELGKRHATF